MNNVSEIARKCCGCGACFQTCPVSAINMVEDNEGFLQPFVDTNKCIGCKKCVTVCQCATNKDVQQTGTKEYYAFSNKNKIDLMNSASGGFVSFLSRAFLQKGDFVGGCIIDSNNEVIHVVTKDIEELKKLSSSKYVQSNTLNTFCETKKLLESNQKVLYIGTPCQIEGLLMFLGKEYDCLLTIDLICHGVPSPLLFRKMVSEIEKKEKTRIDNFNFRCKKKNGWGLYYSYRCVDSDRTKVGSFNLIAYGKDFLEGNAMRESCYECKFARHDLRPADFTVGDFWGVYKKRPDLSNENGVSSVIVNSQKGLDWLKQNGLLGFFNPINLDDVLYDQHNLVCPMKRPAARDSFYLSIDSYNPFKGLKVGLREKIKHSLPRKIRHYLKKIAK